MSSDLPTLKELIIEIRLAIRSKDFATARLRYAEAAAIIAERPIHMARNSSLVRYSEQLAQLEPAIKAAEKAVTGGNRIQITPFRLGRSGSPVPRERY